MPDAKRHNRRNWLLLATVLIGGAPALAIGPATAPSTQTSVKTDEIAHFLNESDSQLPTQTFTFADGSATIELPQGWTTAAQSATYGFSITGPAGQTIIVGASESILAPDSPIVQMSRQNYQLQLDNYRTAQQLYQQALQMRAQYPNMPAPLLPTAPTPPDNDPNIQFPQLTFCRECHGPADVLKYLYPISEAKQKRAGGSYTTLDDVLQVTPTQDTTHITGAASGIVYLRVTDHNIDNTQDADKTHNADKTTSMRVIARMTTVPISNGAWQLNVDAMRAPDSTFDQDVPVMNAIVNSVKLNMQIINAQIASANLINQEINLENQRAMWRNQWIWHHEQERQFWEYQRSVDRQDRARERSNREFDRYIRH